jgi:putative FmdB family regulatory protein
VPLYEYACTGCGGRIERLQRVHDAPLVECPQCGGELKKLASAPALHFKGSGWYVTDYPRGGGTKSDSGDSQSGGAETKADAKANGKADARPDAKPAEKKSDAPAPAPAPAKA